MSQPSRTAATPTYVYVGTYTKTGKGIYLFRLQTENLEVPQNLTLVPLGVVAETPNPSWVELEPKRRLLFAANEVDRFEGQPTGSVSAFSIDAATGKLTALNQRPSMGGGPCHLAIDKTGRHVFVANYGGGSVAVLPIDADGRLGEATAFVQHTGQSVNPQRQTRPHAHCVTLDPANRFVFVCDLGLDKVMTYRFDGAKGTLTPGDPPFTPITPGSGPRHMVFRPDGRFAYVTNELTSTVDAFAYDPQRGALRHLQTVSALPESFEGTSYTAEIDVHPTGKWLYVSNRGHESVVLFTIDASKGTLTYVEEQGTGGKRPRHFGIDSTGRYMAIGNQDSDTALVCSIGAENGRLRPSGVFASVPSPVCLKFFRS
jgi:6-phosphogluconolactonase